MHPYYNGEGYPSGGDGYPANGEGYPSDYSPQRSGSIRYEVRRKNKIRPSAKLCLRFAQTNWPFGLFPNQAAGLIDPLHLQKVSKCFSCMPTFKRGSGPQRPAAYETKI